MTRPAAPRPWRLVGNPKNRRVALFQQALAEAGEPPAVVLPWLDLLTGRRAIDEVPPGAVLRIDSPGENWAVEKALLAAGAAAAEAEGGPTLGGRALADLTEDRGRILFPRQWFLGLRTTLEDWARTLAGRGVRWTAPAAGAVCMFDKIACARRLAAAGVPVPPGLDSPDSEPIAGFDDLAERMAAADCDRAFVKLAHGSSASGVVAVRRGRAGWSAVTSAEIVRGDGGVRLYNSLKVRRYVDPEEVRILIDELARHRALVERWLPKASIGGGGGRAFDLRVVTVAGEPRHTVVRTARGPLTNLHLGGRRGDPAAVRDLLGPERWAAVLETVRRAAAVFPDTLTTGQDVLLTPGGRSHAILEVNAFGDLLPGVLDRGEDVYAAQIAAAAGGGLTAPGPAHSGSLPHRVSDAVPSTSARPSGSAANVKPIAPS